MSKLYKKGDSLHRKSINQNTTICICSVLDFSINTESVKFKIISTIPHQESVSVFFGTILYFTATLYFDQQYSDVLRVTKEFD